jgi:NAD(P)-dependent dehydrogenase (short-subunit alcohol dehydrogenase family)
MRCDDPRSFQQWVLQWRGFGATFEIVPVVPSKETQKLSRHTSTVPFDPLGIAEVEQTGHEGSEETMQNDPENRVALVTGGLRGLGKAMALGLAREGHPVLAVGHIESDVAEMEAEAGRMQISRHFHPFVADLRAASECDRVVAATRERFGKVDILVNCAGLTFTYIDPARFRRQTIQHFWEVGDDIVDNVIATNYLAADRLARRTAPGMVARGWGRIVNVTTKLDTMNRAGTHPYGASKAALEMATEVWAKETEGTGLTVNIVNPGAGANTPGMAEEMREMSRTGRAARLVEPEEMVAPLLYVVSREADRVNGWRFDANLWDGSLSPGEAARRAGRPAGFAMHPVSDAPLSFA